MLETMPIEGTYAHLDEGLAAAQAAREEAGPDAALRVFALLRDQYPDALIVTFQASRMLCDAGRWDDAEAWLSEAIERFPGNLGLASEYARSAQRRHDFSEAARRWQTVCDEFPDNPTGFIGLVSVLRESEQFAAAESVVTTALEQFPDLPGLQVEHGLVAFARRDWATAAERWEILRTSQPEQRLGYLLGAQSLRNCGKMDEADALLAAGIEHFPDAAEMPVEFARMAHARRDWASAVDRWETARERFPDQIACYTGEALALRELGRFDEAEALLDAAVTRFPDQPGPRIEFAGLAQHRRDWQEAARRWAAVREFSPDSPIGYQAGATALRLAGLTEEAETLLTDAVTRFPDHAGILMEYASTAQAQLDWVAATQRWEHLRQIAPGNQTAYAAGAHALRQAGRDQEAEALMEMAIQRFPDDLGLRTSHAWAATHRKDWPEAIDRWNHVLTLQPDNPAGYLGMGRTFRVARRLDEAEAFLEKSMARLPDDAALACEYARVAAARADWDAAQERWELVRTRFPRHPTGYIGLAGVLRDRGEMDAAEQVIEAAIELLPDESGPLVEHAGLAIRRRDWDLAIDRWAKVRERFPHEPEGYAGGAVAMRELRQFDAAETLLEHAIRRFPAAPRPFLEYATVATRRGDWSVAVQRLKEARRYFPGNATIQSALHEAELRVAGDDTEPGAADTLQAEPALAPDPNGAIREVVSAFASLGGDQRGWEFGEMQRCYGTEPLDLLRWTSSQPAGLLAALESRFEGIGLPEQTDVFVVQWANQSTYSVRDLRYGMGTHTFIDQGDAPQEKVAAQACRRMQFLRRKLIEDLEAANKIFVYRMVGRVLHDDELNRLHAAVLSYNSNNTLLYARYADDTHPDGTVEVAGRGLLIGYFAQFGVNAAAQPLTIPFETWATVCRETYRLRQAGAAHEIGDAPEGMVAEASAEQTEEWTEPTGTSAELTEIETEDTTSYPVQHEPATTAGTDASQRPATPQPSVWRRMMTSILRRKA